MVSDPEDGGDGVGRACRRCTMCEGLDHHWLVDCDDVTGKPVMVCKHCVATRPYTDEDDDDE